VEPQLRSFDSFWGKYREETAVGENTGWFGRLSFRAGIALSSAALLAAVVIAALTFLPSYMKTNSGLLLTGVSGNGVELRENGRSEWTSLGRHAKIRTGSALKTGGNSAASSEMEIKEISVPGTGPVAVIEMKEGHAAFHYQKQPDTEGLRVLTPTLNVSVVGTKFMVSLDARTNSRVSVLDGTVDVRPNTGFIEDAVRQELLTPEQGEKYKQSLAASFRLAGPGSIQLDDKAMERFYSESMNLIRTFGKTGTDADDRKAMEKIAGLWAALADASMSPSGGHGKDMEELRVFTGEEMVMGNAGRVLWQKEIAGISGPKKTVLLDNGSICFSAGRYLFIFSSSGDLLNKIEVCDEGSSLTCPAVKDKMIVVGSDNGGLFAYDDGGKPLWSKKDAGLEMFNACPVMDRDWMAVPTVDRGVLVYDRNGSVVHSNIGGKKETVYSTPLVVNNGGGLLCGNQEGELYYYDMGRSKVTWKTSLVRDVLVYPLVGSDTAAVVLGRADGQACAVRPSDGAVLWRKTFGELTRTKINPAFTDGKFVLCGGRTVFIIDARSGSTVWRKELPSGVSDMAVNGFHAYVSDENGAVYEIDMRRGAVSKIYQSEKGDVQLVCGGDGLVLITDSEIVRLSASDRES
jgi:outer membrane protein assembly factor BamB